MAESKAIRAGRAFVELFADSTHLHAGLKRAQAMLQGFGASVRRIGAGLMAAGLGIVGGLLGSAKVFQESGDALDKMAQRTGIVAEELSALSFAAKSSATDMETFEGAIRRMQKLLSSAGGGNKAARVELEKLGLSADKLKDLSPDKQFKLIADQISKLPTATQRAAAAMGMFGKAGTQLLPMMEGGAVGIQKLLDRAHELGVVMSGDDVKAASALDDAMDELHAVMARTLQVIGAAVAPALQDIAERITRVIVGVNKWIDKNRGLVTGVLVAATGAVVFGGAMIAAGIGISVLAKAIGFLTGPLKLIPGVLNLVKTSFLLLFSPGGLLVAGVLTAAAAFVYFANSTQQTMDVVGKAWTGIKDDVKLGLRGIVAAIQTGDIETAWEIVTTTVQLVWARALQAITELFPSMSRMTMAVGESLLSIWIRVTSALKIAWVSVTGFMSQKWYEMGVSIVNVFVKVWDAIRPIQRGIAEAAARVAGKLAGMSDKEIDQHIEATLDTNLDESRSGVTAKAKELRAALASNAEQTKNERIALIRAAVKEEQEALAELAKLTQQRDEEDINNRQKRIKELEDRIAALKKKQQDLVNKAETDAATGREFKLPDFQLGLKSIEGRSSVGAFEGAAKQLLGLSGRDKLEKVVDAIDEGNDILEDIRDKNGLAFE